MAPRRPVHPARSLAALHGASATLAKPSTSHSRWQPTATTTRALHGIGAELCACMPTWRVMSSTTTAILKRTCRVGS